jgi:hypothetical protein
VPTRAFALDRRLPARQAPQQMKAGQESSRQLNLLMFVDMGQFCSLTNG